MALNLWCLGSGFMFVHDAAQVLRVLSLFLGAFTCLILVSLGVVWLWPATLLGVGLAMVLMIYRNRRSIALDELSEMKG